MHFILLKIEAISNLKYNLIYSYPHFMCKRKIYQKSLFLNKCYVFSILIDHYLILI